VPGRVLSRAGHAGSRGGAQLNITVFLADDHTIVRDGLRALLEAQGDMRVVGEAATGREALSRLRGLSESVVIDVAIIDIAMPEMNGIDVTREIASALPSTAVIILSMYSTAEHVARAFEAGARAFLVKESAGAEVVSAVRTVHAGGRYVSGRVPGNLIPAHPPLVAGAGRTPLADLTERERRILGLLAAGRSPREIARALHASGTSVETMCDRLMERFSEHDLQGLAEFAAAHGLAPSTDVSSRTADVSRDDG
jgi:DNA-binding NarL/FixJ family response regulator